MREEELTMPLIDTTFIYHVQANSYEAFCRLRIYRHNDQTVVIVTEPATNTGMSVTNAAGELAAQVCTHYNIDAAELIWVEHYGPDYMAKCRPNSDETFDRVHFTWQGERCSAPRWSPSSRAAVAALIGQAL